MTTKLILVEGIPGSGKSSTAQFIAHFLESKGLTCELFIEGDPNHPADYESTAYFTRAQFEDFIEANKPYESVLRRDASVFERHVLLSYGKMREKSDVPKELINEISKYEVYELPLQQHCELLLEKWESFADLQKDKDTVVIFECCFLQNPMCKLFVQHDEQRDDIFRYMNKLAHLLEKLDPILIYLNPFDVNATINKARLERPREWLNAVVWYHTQQGYGQKRGLSGIDGYVEVLAQRQSLELDILENLPMNSLRIDNPQSDWSKTHLRIQEMIQPMIAGD